MANIVTYLSDRIRPYSTMIIVIFLVIMFLLAGYYAYNQFYRPMMKNQKFNDVANSNQRNDVIIYFFHVDWCPHCKSAMPEWTQFSAEYDGKIVNGYTVRCIEIDCSDDKGAEQVTYKDKDGVSVLTTDATVSQMIQKYDIQGYPTIKMLKDGYTIDFESKITYSALEKFANSVTK